MSQVVTEWMIGWKLVLAYCADDLKTIRFVPIHQDGLVSPYGVDAVAECQQCAWHQPPENGCHCGFNAWHDRSMNDRYRLARSLAVARDTNGNGSFVELRVGLYGTVVEGTLWQEGGVDDAATALRVGPLIRLAPYAGVGSMRQKGLGVARLHGSRPKGPVPGGAGTREVRRGAAC